MKRRQRSRKSNKRTIGRGGRGPFGSGRAMYETDRRPAGVAYDSGLSLCL